MASSEATRAGLTPSEAKVALGAGCFPTEGIVIFLIILVGPTSKLNFTVGVSSSDSSRSLPLLSNLEPKAESESESEPEFELLSNASRFSELPLELWDRRLRFEGRP